MEFVYLLFGCYHVFVVNNIYANKQYGAYKNTIIDLQIKNVSKARYPG